MSYGNGRGAGSGKDRVGQPNLKEGQDNRRRTSPANHRIPHLLDGFGAEKIRRRSAEGLAFGATLMARAAAQVDVLPGGAIFVFAVGATQVVDGLAGKGFRGEAGAGDYDLAVFIAISGVGGLVTGHTGDFWLGTAYSASRRRTSRFSLITLRADSIACVKSELSRMPFGVSVI